MEITNSVTFAPQLYIKSGLTDVSFYTNAFSAKELRRFENPDGSIHVVEFSIAGQLFHLHEENESKGLYAPSSARGTSVIIGLFVSSVDDVMKKAVAAGATVLSPAQDYDYGYRQGQLKDPFGHVWMIEQVI